MTTRLEAAVHVTKVHIVATPVQEHRIITVPVCAVRFLSNFDLGLMNKQGQQQNKTTKLRSQG